jgi:hypothetical protein
MPRILLVRTSPTFPKDERPSPRGSLKPPFVSERNGSPPKRTGNPGPAMGIPTAQRHAQPVHGPIHYTAATISAMTRCALLSASLAATASAMTG